VQYDDPRLLTVCATSPDAGLNEEAVSFLEPWLWRDGSPQAQVAALVSGGHELKRPEARLRAAILSGRQDVAPPLDADSESVWLAEIGGPGGISPGPAGTGRGGSLAATEVGWRIGRRPSGSGF
jgi:hypothetical protein